MVFTLGLNYVWCRANVPCALLELILNDLTQLWIQTDNQTNDIVILQVDATITATISFNVMPGFWLYYNSTSPWTLGKYHWFQHRYPRLCDIKDVFDSYRRLPNVRNSKCETPHDTLVWPNTGGRYRRMWRIYVPPLSRENIEVVYLPDLCHCAMFSLVTYGDPL